MWEGDGCLESVGSTSRTSPFPPWYTVLVGAKLPSSDASLDAKELFLLAMLDVERVTAPLLFTLLRIAIPSFCCCSAISSANGLLAVLTADVRAWSFFDRVAAGVFIVGILGHDSSTMRVEKVAAAVKRRVRAPAAPPLASERGQSALSLALPKAWRIRFQEKSSHAVLVCWYWYVHTVFFANSKHWGQVLHDMRVTGQGARASPLTTHACHDRTSPRHNTRVRNRQTRCE